ncbi:glycosyl hydrolase 115 family protein [Cohnella sp. GCM10027633]|uniref:glycosyl hydrolase 115 family protein n=1 Tax=unclassified Cohnella TaxID=2636738 RepID=UPI003643E303
MTLIIDRHTTYRLPKKLTSPVRHAWGMVERDLKNVFGEVPKLKEDDGAPVEVEIRYALPEDLCPGHPESFSFRFIEAEGAMTLHITAHDDLGLVFGLLEYSRRYLGVDPFWFWMDKYPMPRHEIHISEENYDSPESFVRFRGWFVNDEVCLIGWKEEYPPAKEVWYPVFEALLRCGGNMVIPGTDLPKHGIHADLASEMGLWVTHHHAEPLGAEMFLRAYPGKQASYQDNPELFEALWEEAIEAQKDRNIVWVLSFRGQGDQPFWIQDPSFDTPEKRGEMISRVVRRQYDMVREKVENPNCCVALYGEIAELYKAGHIDIPEDIMRIWADNGYGKMVSRRHNNHNLRVPSLPSNEGGGKHGVYYHVTFHDLQASNHMTLFPLPTSFIQQELGDAFHSGAFSYLLVNSGNVRPHVYTLDFIRELWSKGHADSNEHLLQFVRRMYSVCEDEIVALLQDYAKLTISYGPNEDDRAGEEFYHHPAREIVGHWLQGRDGQPLERLNWATGPVGFAEQVDWFSRRCADAVPGWQLLEERIEQLITKLPNEEQQRMKDHLLLHVKLHQSGCEGFAALGDSYIAYSNKEFPAAFVHASRAMWCYQQGIAAMQEAEHGHWHNFYRADWLTNIQSTVNNMDTVRRWLRMHGDSPDFFAWYKNYLMPETEKYIYLENTHRNPLSDDDLAQRLQKKFELYG